MGALKMGFTRDSVNKDLLIEDFIENHYESMLDLIKESELDKCYDSVYDAMLAYIYENQAETLPSIYEWAIITKWEDTLKGAK